LHYFNVKERPKGKGRKMAIGRKVKMADRKEEDEVLKIQSFCTEFTAPPQKKH
jgi:hypothetical protein